MKFRFGNSLLRVCLRNGNNNQLYTRYKLVYRKFEFFIIQTKFISTNIIDTRMILINLINLERIYIYIYIHKNSISFLYSDKRNTFFSF